MALVRFGGGVSEMIGSAGGNTWSRNSSGPYMRKRVKPVNPNSFRQSRVRAIMSAIVAAWSGVLTQLQRDDWITFAKNMPEKNGLGEVIRFSGFVQYVKANVAAQNADGAAILDGPAIFVLPGEDSTMTAVGSEAAQTIDISFDDSLPWVGQDGARLIVQMGIPKGDGITFFNGPWRHAGSVEGNLALPPTTPATLPAPFPIVENQKIHVRARIQEADGRLSDTFLHISTVGA